MCLTDVQLPLVRRVRVFLGELHDSPLPLLLLLVFLVVSLHGGVDALLDLLNHLVVHFFRLLRRLYHRRLFAESLVVHHPGIINEDLFQETLAASLLLVRLRMFLQMQHGDGRLLALLPLAMLPFDGLFEGLLVE